jgi:hypothetical protein
MIVNLVAARPGMKKSDVLEHLRMAGVRVRLTELVEAVGKLADMGVVEIRKGQHNAHHLYADRQAHLRAQILEQVRLGVVDLSDLFGALGGRRNPDLTYRQVMQAVAELVESHELVPVTVALPADYSRWFIVPPPDPPESPPSVHQAPQRHIPGMIGSTKPSKAGEAK